MPGLPGAVQGPLHVAQPLVTHCDTRDLVSRGESDVGSAVDARPPTEESGVGTPRLAAPGEVVDA